MYLLGNKGMHSLNGNMDIDDNIDDKEKEEEEEDDDDDDDDDADVDVELDMGEEENVDHYNYNVGHLHPNIIAVVKPSQFAHEKYQQLHSLMYFKPKQLQAILDHRDQQYPPEFNVDKLEFHPPEAMAVEEFFTLPVYKTVGKDETHYAAKSGEALSGEFWISWITCKTASTINDQFQVNAVPTGIVESDWWKHENKKPGRGTNNFRYHIIQYRLNNPQVWMPTLGTGKYSVSHLCDTEKCYASKHICKNLNHSINISRIGCCGARIYVYKEKILFDQPCIHEYQKYGCCTRIYVIVLNDSEMKAILLNVDKQ
jgi:hypothetical protein